MSEERVPAVDDAPQSWADANQRHILAAVAEVRRAVELRASPDAAADPAPSLAPVETHPDGPFALDTLTACFGLSAFERSIVVLAAAMELDASMAPLCAEAQGDPRRAAPTFALALAALPAPHWSALGPSAPLRRWRLVEVGGGELLTRSPLRIEERVLHHLTGVAHLDERLLGWVDAVRVPESLTGSHRELADRMRALWTRGGDDVRWPLVQLVGESPRAKRAVAARVCAEIGLALHCVRASDLPSAGAERESFLRLWGREAALGPSALLVEAEDLDAADRAKVTAVIDRIPGLVAVGVREPLPPLRRPAVRIDVARPTTDEQRALWRRHLGPAAASLNGHVDHLVGHFSLGEDAIRAACADVLGRDGEAPDDALWESCRTQARPRLDDMAQRIESAAGWDDLVLPDAPKQLLREIAGQVHHRGRVYESWGFGAAGGRGLGVTALFAGASGTGKTMAAEVLARQLRLDLYRIDLSQVVSKYIGETEKNLRRVFDAAEGGGVILLFDEADALFGRRSEVKDSHDRYANIEVSYLLQRMEAYRGLAILTTNLRTALDPAFLRRLRFVVTFPYPDAAQREEIWRHAFPARAPTDGVDPSRLAQLNVAGGNIRNIALQAAFLAAEGGEPVRMRHLLRAARGECAKLERMVSDAEIGGWV